MLITYPNPVLRGQAERVTEWPQPELVERMWAVIREHNGIGLAAPQIGVNLQVCVLDVDGFVCVLANPVITERSLDFTVGSEGCLSCPGDERDVQRHAEVVVEGLNERGNTVRVDAKGMVAVALQHELDHLRGTLIIDY